MKNSLPIDEVIEVAKTAPVAAHGFQEHFNVSGPQALRSLNPTHTSGLIDWACKNKSLDTLLLCLDAVFVVGEDCQSDWLVKDASYWINELAHSCLFEDYEEGLLTVLNRVKTLSHIQMDEEILFSLALKSAHVSFSKALNKILGELPRSKVDMEALVFESLGGSGESRSVISENMGGVLTTLEVIFVHCGPRMLPSDPEGTPFFKHPLQKLSAWPDSGLRLTVGQRLMDQGWSLYDLTSHLINGSSRHHLTKAIKSKSPALLNDLMVYENALEQSRALKKEIFNCSECSNLMDHPKRKI